MKLNFIDHIVLIVKDLHKTSKFYSSFLGKPIKKESFQVYWMIGKTKLFFVTSNKKNSKEFDKENIGLNHLAFGAKNLKELKEMEKLLKRGKIRNSGIKICPYSKREFIWFDDHDKIRLEFYLRYNRMRLISLQTF